MKSFFIAVAALCCTLPAFAGGNSRFYLIDGQVVERDIGENGDPVTKSDTSILKTNVIDFATEKTGRDQTCIVDAAGNTICSNPSGLSPLPIATVTAVSANCDCVANTGACNCSQTATAQTASTGSTCASGSGKFRPLRRLFARLGNGFSRLSQIER